MKTYLKTLLPLALVLAISGCMLPNFKRVIPENKSSRIRIVNPFYGYVEIDTRVIGDTNNLAPMPVPGVTLEPNELIQPSQPFVPSNLTIKP